MGLSVRGVTVRYGAVAALDDVTLEVAAGDVLAVIGPSGSGKSTLLRAIAGLEQLASGVVEAGGRPLDGVPTHRRDLGLMFQDHALFPHLTVAGNVAFGLEMQGWSQPRQRERVVELLDLVGLTSFGDRPITELSGGEAQRVALARALAPAPALLMLDEPFGSLDRVLRRQLTAELSRLLTELDQTALHVTHDQEEAFALADRVAVLRAGRVEQLGRPEDLWTRPVSTFVAEFLGHPNIWPVTVGEDDGVVSLGSAELGRSEQFEPGRRHVVVPAPAVSRAATESQASLSARVQRVVFGEGYYRVLADVLDGEPGTTVTFQVDERLDPGSVVGLVVDTDRLHPVDDDHGR